MYDEQVKRLREPCQYENCILCQQAADAIEELQSDNTALNGTVSNLIQQIAELSKPKWIPVTERLPEAGERVLCYCRANIYEVMKMRTDGAWVHNDKVYDSAYMSGFVTHWMPLPAPPKEE